MLRLLSRLMRLNNFNEPILKDWKGYYIQSATLPLPYEPLESDPVRGNQSK
jgi:hypothetical protein